MSRILILDTETTGLGPDAEICEIAIIDIDGNILIDTLIRTKNPIPDDAIKIHGITNEMVANAPLYSDLHDQITTIIDQSEYLLIYNAAYDLRLLKNTAALYNLPPAATSAICVMLTYCEMEGITRWQKLVNAASQKSISTDDLTAHRALADCEITRRLMMEYDHSYDKYVTIELYG